MIHNPIDSERRLLTLSILLSQGTKTDTDDLLLSAYCDTCDSLVGYEVRSLNTSQSIPIDFRLLKYASSPNPKPLDIASSAIASLRTYPLATHLMARMLEIGRAHACHRFVVEDVESETARVLVSLHYSSGGVAR